MSIAWHPGDPPPRPCFRQICRRCGGLKHDGGRNGPACTCHGSLPAPAPAVPALTYEQWLAQQGLADGEPGAAE